MQSTNYAFSATKCPSIG